MYVPIFDERLPIELALLINIEEPDYSIKEENMFETLDERDDLSDIKNIIDPSKNIIISTPLNQNIIKRNTIGTISILNHTDINLGNGKLLTNNMAILEFIPKIKIITPKGIYLKFESPPLSQYHLKSYNNYQIIDRHEEDEIPSYLIYQNFNILQYIDLDQFKKINNKTLLLKQYTELLECIFYPIYFAGSHTFPNIETFYWIKNDEIYNTLDDIY